MIIDEIHYDADTDYGFFCALDDCEHDSRDQQKPLQVNDRKKPEEEWDSIEYTNNKDNSITIRIRFAILNGLIVFGTCISSIIICYKYMNRGCR